MGVCCMVKMDSNKMVAEIDLKENAVYRVIDGRIYKVDKPGIGYGKQVITWQNGKPVICEISYTVK
jgi:hypothetical protein